MKNIGKRKRANKDGSGDSDRTLTKKRDSKATGPTLDPNKCLLTHEFTKAEREACPLITPHKGALEQFTWPMCQADFMSKVYRKTAYVTKGPASRFRCLIGTWLHDLDNEQLVGNTMSEKVFVWMSSLENDNTENATDKKLKSFALDDHSAALACHAAGASLYFRAPEELHRVLVAGMADDLGMDFASKYPNGDNKGEIETFVSRAGMVTGFHFDYMENFTFQLKGKKKWTLKKSTVPHPVRGCTPHYDTIDTAEQQMKLHTMIDPDFSSITSKPSFGDDDVTSVILEPGDCFYHPAGIWHRVECTEDSVSINVSLMPSSWGDLLADGLKHRMMKESLFREGIVMRSYDDGKKRMEEALCVLKRVVNDMTVDDFFPRGLMDASEGVIRITPETLANNDLNVAPASAQHRLNPLASLVKQSRFDENRLSRFDESAGGAGGAGGAGADEGEKEEVKGSGDGDGDGYGDGDGDGDGDDDGNDDKENDNAAADEDDDNDDDDDTLEHYMLNINFGNEQMESWLRKSIRVSEEFVAFVDALLLLKGAIGNYHLKSLATNNGMSNDNSQKILMIMVREGIFSPLSPLATALK